MGENFNKDVCLTIQMNGDMDTCNGNHSYEHSFYSHKSPSNGHIHQHNLLTEEEWRQYMKNEISEASTPLVSKGPKISTAPQALLDVKPQSYCPRILTIGPLNQMLGYSSIDKCKALCVKKFMERHHILNVEDLMEQFLTDLDHNLESHYNSNPPKYSSESSQLLFTIDAVFILEFLLFMKNDCRSEDDKGTRYLYTFFNNDITHTQMCRDLFLIGNQIPMSFLKKVAEISKMSVEISNEIPKNHRFGTNSLKDYLNHIVFINHPFFGSQFHHRSTQANWMQTINFLNCNHLLDCLYVSCTQPPPEPTRQLINPTKILVRGFQKSKKAEGSKKKYNRLPNASQLLKAGIRFKACEGNISVIKYNKRKFQLDLPQIVVADNTEDILRNLLAHEQTSKEGGEFCMYAFIMDSLIDTPDDLAILTKSHVIENLLGSDERLVQMWNDMCRNLGAQPCQRWEEITRDVMGHYNSHWRILYVEFCAKFFSRPWLWISLVGAFVLLVFSLVQTIYTVLGYYKA